MAGQVVDTSDVDGGILTRLYLYGKIETPVRLTDRLLDRGPEEAHGPVFIPQASYMSTYGKYAVPARSTFVKGFFEGAIVLEPGTYTVASLKSQYSPGMFGFDLAHSKVDIGSETYMDRSYIFNNQRFELTDSTVFKVAADGTRTMENVRVHVQNEDFDFVSKPGSWAQILNDNVLAPRIDPYTIGRKVLIEYTGEAAAFFYGADAYVSDLARIDGWDGDVAQAAAYIGANIFGYLQKMEDAGVFSYQKGERDIIYDGLGQNSLVPNSVSVSVILVAGGGGDSLRGSHGSDIIYGGDGDDTIIASLGSDELYGGNEPDTPSIVDRDTVSYDERETAISIRYQQGQDSSYLVEVTKTGALKDQLFSIERIVGTNRADRLAVIGNIAADTNLEVDGGGPSNNVVDLRAAAAAIRLVVDGSANGVLRDASTGGEIKLSAFKSSVLGSAYDDRIVIDGGSETRVNAGDGNDYVSASGGPTKISGGNGDDELHGSDDSDILVGGEGSNTLHGGAGSDLLVSSSGSDQLFGGSGHDTIRMKIVIPSADSTGSGIATQDQSEVSVASGGPGNDYIIAEFPDEVPDGGIPFSSIPWMTFGPGDGHDTTNAQIRFEGVEIDDLDFVWDVPNAHGFHEGALAIIIRSTGDSVLTYAFGQRFSDGWYLYFGAEIDGRAGFAWYLLPSRVTAGSVAQYDKAKAAYEEAVATTGEELTGTTGSDELTGGIGDDEIQAGDGDDLVRASGGTDKVFGGPGRDLFEFFGRFEDFRAVRNRDGSVTMTDLTGLEGAVTLFDVEAVNFVTEGVVMSILELVGDYGTPSSNPHLPGTPRSDNLFGLEGDDVLVGFEGDDFIDGGSGRDRAVFFGNSADYTITYNADGTVTVQHLSGTDGTDILAEMEELYFEGDRVLKTLQGAPPGQGTEGPDVLVGGSDDDSISGLGGDDSLRGGQGNDFIFGGEGSDTYLYSAGDGNDLIVENESNQTDSDTLNLLGFTLADLRLLRGGVNGNDLEIELIPTGHKIRVVGQFDPNSGGGLGHTQGLEVVLTTDGSLDRQALLLAGLINPPPVLDPDSAAAGASYRDLMLYPSFEIV